MAGLALVNFYERGREAMGPFWALWLGLSILLILFSGVWRRPGPRAGMPLYRNPRSQREYVPLLALCAFTTFIGWLLAQLLYAAMMRAPLSKEGDVALLSPRDIAFLSLLASLVGWGVGVSMVRGSRTVEVIGYSLRRLLPGMRDGLFGIFIAMPFVYVAYTITQRLWMHLTQQPQTQHELLRVMNNTSSPLVEVAVVLAAVVAAPLFEELLFRGFVQGGLRRLVGSRWIAVFVSSALFAAIHDRWTIPPIFVLSLFLGFAYERKGNLWTSTTMHALFNLFNIITSRMG